MSKWEVTDYHGKPVYTGHWPKHEGKIGLMVRLLGQYGWCFQPVPAVDLGTHYQALDGSHRIAACKRIGRQPELVVVDMRMHPEQPIPDQWVEILNAPLAHKRVIRGYARQPDVKADHIGVVLDTSREILRIEYVEHMFNLLLQLTRKGKMIREGDTK